MAAAAGGSPEVAKATYRAMIAAFTIVKKPVTGDHDRHEVSDRSFRHHRLGVSL